MTLYMQQRHISNVPGKFSSVQSTPMQTRRCLDEYYKSSAIGTARGALKTYASSRPGASKVCYQDMQCRSPITFMKFDYKSLARPPPS